MEHHNVTSGERLFHLVCKSITTASALIVAAVGIWALAFTLRQIHEMRDDSKRREEGRRPRFRRCTRKPRCSIS